MKENEPEVLHEKGFENSKLHVEENFEKEKIEKILRSIRLKQKTELDRRLKQLIFLKVQPVTQDFVLKILKMMPHKKLKIYRMRE